MQSTVARTGLGRPVNRPDSLSGGGLPGSGHRERTRLPLIVQHLELRRRDAPDWPQQTPVAEPLYPAGCLQLDRRHALPWPQFFDDLRLVQPGDRLRRGGVVRVADAARRQLDLRFRQLIRTRGWRPCERPLTQPAIGRPSELQSADADPEVYPGIAAALEEALRADGFTVQEGQVILIDVLALCCHGQIPTCLGFNPLGPYKVVRLPDAPGQTTRSSFPWVFRLGANEAVVLIGRTPPPVTYFSYDSYVMTRHSDREDVRKVIFGNLGDAINNLTLDTGEPSQDLFGQDVIIIFTADQSIDARIRGAAAAVGYPAGMVNTGVIPAAIARLGLEQNADEFSIVHRVAPATGRPGERAVGVLEDAAACAAHHAA